VPINYPAYREHRDAAESANNAIMALFVGSQLAARTLTLTSGSPHLLSEIFPLVPHISRLDLTAAAASDLIDSAEVHLADVAVPHALALHEGYINSVRDLLLASGIPVPLLGLKWNASNMHTILFAALGAPVPSGHDLFELLRRLRNAVIHNASMLDSYAVAAVPLLSGASEARWMDVVGSPATKFVAGDKLSMGLGEVMMAFSTTRYLTAEINGALGGALPRTQWANMVVQDYADTEPIGFKSSMRLAAKLQRFAHLQYRPLGMTSSELRAEAVNVGVSPIRL